MSVEVWVSGPIIDILLRGNMPGAPALQLQGIVDTGASVICLDRRVALRLGLTSISKKAMEVADGSVVEAIVYMADLTVPALDFRDWVEIYALPMERPSTRVLLGRSFLKGYHVTYSGPNETLHYHKVIAPPPEDWDG